jgi:hypothetical protein
MAQYSLVAYFLSWTYDATNVSVTHHTKYFCILACSIESCGCVCVVGSVLYCSSTCCPHLESVIGRIAVSARLYRSDLDATPPSTRSTLVIEWLLILSRWRSLFHPCFSSHVRPAKNRLPAYLQRQSRLASSYT